MKDLVKKSYSSYSTKTYDQFQLLTNGIPYWASVYIYSTHRMEGERTRVSKCISYRLYHSTVKDRTAESRSHVGTDTACLVNRLVPCMAQCGNSSLGQDNRFE
jgi:hypothetical protein